MELTTESITEYLKYASELETSVYNQQQIVDKAKESIKLDLPPAPVFQEPIKREPDCEKPNPEDYVVQTQTGGASSGCFSFVLLGGGFLLSAYGICQFGSMIVLAIILILIGLGLLGLGLFNIYINSGHSKYEKDEQEEQERLQKERYEHALKTYEDSCKQVENDYERAVEKNKKEFDRKQKKYEEKEEAARKNYANAKAEISILSKSLGKTKGVLADLYKEDVIYEKYHNLVAVTTMYEYFLSGRVSELAGPDGAYNLYEQELRQNVIINKLDTVIDHLEKIEQNQFYLYKAIESGNKTREQILKEVTSVNKGLQEGLSDLKEIKANSKAAAYSADITAQNTEALKYITLLTQ